MISVIIFMNQYENRYSKIVNELIMKSFPELKNFKIILFESNAKRFEKHSADIFYGFFFAVIRVSKKVRKFPRKALVGLFAHELSHFTIFHNRRPFQKFLAGFNYLTSKKHHKKEERDTDRFAIKRGYWKELYFTRVKKKEVYGFSLDDNYLNPKEIKSYVKKIRKW